MSNTAEGGEEHSLREQHALTKFPRSKPTLPERLPAFFLSRKNPEKNPSDDLNMGGGSCVNMRFALGSVYSVA